MKKSSLVMILALVGMVGCSSGKHVEPPDFQRIADEWNHAHPRDGVSYGNAAVILPATKFPVVSVAWVKEHECHEVYSSEPRDKFPGYKLYRCKRVDADVEVDEPASKPKPKAKKLVAMTGDGPLECSAGYKLENHACVKIEPDFVPTINNNIAITSYSSFTVMDRDGDCTWHGFEYDPKTNMCNLTITFSVPTQLGCTPLVINEAGEPMMTCSYTPFRLVEKAK